jgi:hypothetical protein
MVCLPEKPQFPKSFILWYYLQFQSDRVATHGKEQSFEKEWNV